jgi:mediator of RNA polymerase II transcription subunit 6
MAIKLQSIYDTAADMQFFSPAQGYTTLKASSKPSTSRTGALRSSAVPSLRNTPARGASPGAESAAPSHAGFARDHQQDQEQSEDNELFRSLQASMVFADDYIDLNPLMGEPGTFKFQSTQQHAKEQAAAAKAAAERKEAKPLPQIVSTKTSTAPTPAPSGTSEKPPTARKGSKTPKMVNKTLKRKTSDG